MMAVSVSLARARARVPFGDVVRAVSSGGVGVGVIVVGAAWHVTGVAGHDCRLVLRSSLMIYTHI